MLEANALGFRERFIHSVLSLGVEIRGFSRREGVRIKPHVFHEEWVMFRACDLRRIGRGRDL